MRSSPRTSARRCICGSADCSRRARRRPRLEEKIFEIVNQLDRGAALITSPEERERVAELNLMAGKRAKAATAYASALNYLAAGRALLAEDSWERQLRAHLRARVPPGRVRVPDRRACGGGGAALDAVAPRRERSSTSPPSRVCAWRSTRPWIGATAPSRSCLEYLRRVGVDWSPHPTDEEVAAGIRADVATARRPGDRGAHRPAADERSGLARDHGRSHRARAAGVVHRRESALVSSSVAWRTSASSMATATDRASPMPGSACVARAALRRLPRRDSASASSASIWWRSAA